MLSTTLVKLTITPRRLPGFCRASRRTSSLGYGTLAHGSKTARYGAGDPTTTDNSATEAVSIPQSQYARSGGPSPRRTTGRYPTRANLMARWAVIATLGAIVGCTGDPDPVADAETELDARVCSPDPSRDVSVLWVMQNQSDAINLMGMSRPLAAELVTQLRARFSGRLRFASINGHINPADVSATGCTGPEGVGDVFHVGTDRDGIAAGPVVLLDPDGDVERAIDDLSRVALTYGDQNCSNQLLESALRALAPDALGLSVPHGSVRGDHENAGFVAPGDLLLVLFSTLLDDCSWNERVEVGSRFACPRDGHPYCCESVLFPVQRYIDGFRALGAALGVDLVLATMSAGATPDRPLSDWRATPYPLCAGYALEGVPYRLIEVAEALAPRSTTQPLCDLYHGRSDTPMHDEVAVVIERLVAASCR